MNSNQFSKQFKHCFVSRGGRIASEVIKDLSVKEQADRVLSAEASIRRKADYILPQGVRETPGDRPLCGRMVYAVENDLPLPRQCYSCPGSRERCVAYNL